MFYHVANRGDTSVTGGTITIPIGTGAANACTDGDSIDVSGVRLAIAGSGLTGDVEASIAVDGDFRLESGGNRATIINAVVDELTANGASTGFREAGKLTLVRHTGEPDGAAQQFVLTITENTVDSFDDAELELEFSGIPPGATLTLDAWVSAEDADLNTDDRINQAAVDAALLETPPRTIPLTSNDEVDVDYEEGASSVTAEENEAVIQMSLSGDDAALGGVLSGGVDKITLRGSIVFDVNIRGFVNPVAELPLEDLDIAVTVDVGPVGNAFGRRGAIITDPPIRFASDKSGPVTVIDVESSQTSLTLPYALSDGVFDTGIAIANMNTADDQSGTITFALYQTGEDMVEYTTPDELDAGGTIAVLLSDILNEVGVETFQGYIMITTDFTGADGLAYISDWAAFSATATLDVVE